MKLQHLITLVAARQWFTSVQYQDKVQVGIVNALVDSATYTPLDAVIDSSYPSDAIGVYSGQVYFVSQTLLDQTPGNVTLALQSIPVQGTQVQELFKVEPLMTVAVVGEPATLTMPVLRNLVIHQSQGALYVASGWLNAANITKVDLATKRVSLFYTFSGESISDIQIDELRNKLYVATYQGIYTFDLSVTGKDPPPPVKISSFSPQGTLTFDWQMQTVMWPRYNQANFAVMSRSLLSLNTSFYQNQVDDTVVFNSTGSIITSADSRFYLDRVSSRLVVLSSASVYAIPYPPTKVISSARLLLNQTIVDSKFERFYSLLGGPEEGQDGYPDIQPSGIGLAVTVVTVVTAAAVGAATLSGGAGAGASGAAGGVVGGNAALGNILAACQPVSLLLSVVSQMQFMVIFTQIGGQLPSLFTSFTSEISWITLGFKKASFGIPAKPDLTAPLNGMRRYAAVVQMAQSQIFGSLMIFLIIFFSSLLLVYCGLLLASKWTDNSLIAKAKAKIPNLVGRLFLFSYVTLCSLSVNQISINDPPGQFFGFMVLMFICFAFVLVVALAQYYELPQENPEAGKQETPVSGLKNFLNLVATVSKMVFDIFFKDSMCSDFKTECHNVALWLILCQFMTGFVTGAIQNVPVLQIVFMLFIQIFETFQYGSRRPHKIEPICNLEIVSGVVKALSLMIKLGLTAAQDNDNAAAGATLLFFNLFLIFIMIVGVIVGLVHNNPFVWNKAGTSKADEPKKTVEVNK